MPRMRQLSFDGFHEWDDPSRPTADMKLANRVRDAEGAEGRKPRRRSVAEVFS